MKKGTNRFLVPFFGQVKFYSVHNEQGIDNDKEMMWVPKGVEASEIIEGLGKLDPASSEPRGS